MALAPQMGADTGADTGATDPTAAAPPVDTDAAASPDVLVTIAKDPSGGYLVSAGDEDGDEGAPAAAPQHAAGVGAALKLALDILNESEASAGEAGGSDDQFAAGFGASKEPTPSAAPRGRSRGMMG